MIILYSGRRGSGKTLTMVKDAFRYYKNGWKIFSNIELGFPHEYISDEDILNIQDNEHINNCVLVIDEIQILIDSRKSMSNKNVGFTHFIQQIRKRNIVVLGTTQFKGTVDLRLRQHLDVEARPKHFPKFDVCEVVYVDITAMESWDIDEQTLDSVKTVYDCKPVYVLYDTNKIIKVKKRKDKKKKDKN